MTEREELWCAVLKAQGWGGEIDVHILPTPEHRWSHLVNSDPLHDLWQLRLDIGRRTGEEVTLYIVGTVAREFLFKCPDAVAFRGDVWASLGDAGCPVMWGWHSTTTKPESQWDFPSIDPGRAAVAFHQNGGLYACFTEKATKTLAIIEGVV